MIQACYSVWMEENRIGASIASIHDYVDRVLVIDGRYEGFAPDEPVESTDHTRHIATKFPKVQFIQLHDALRPAKKRMMLFGWEFNQSPADWFIVIDADEVMYGRGMNRAFDILRNEPPVKGYKVKTFLDLQRLASNTPNTFTRIMHKSAGFRYAPNHWQRFDKDGRDMDSYCELIPADVVILQMNELCPDWRQQEKSRWVTWRSQRGVGW